MSYTINNVIQKLNGIVPTIEDDKLRNKLQLIVNKLASKDLLFIEWSIDDVKSVDVNVTDPQARDVLELVDRRHDCNYGVTWDLIDYCIKEVI